MSDDQAEVLDREVETVEDQAPLDETQEGTQEAPETQQEDQQEKTYTLEDKQKAEAGFQKRANQLTKEKYGLKDRAEKAEAKLAKLQINPGSEPKIEDFDFDQDTFINQTVDYRVQQETAKALAQQKQVTINAERQKQGLAYTKKADSLGLSDFQEVSEQIASVNPSIEMIDAIIGDKNGPQMAYYLGKNLDIAADIQNASPYQAGKMLAELSFKLANTKAKKKLTTAPDPVQTVNSGGSIKKDIADMSMEEYEEYHNSQ